MYYQQHSTVSVEKISFDFNPSLKGENVVHLMHNDTGAEMEDHLHCTYSYNKLRIQTSYSTKKIRAIILIQPIGVGIGRWYYDRLFETLSEYDYSNIQCDEHLFLAPDLLGCGTASDIRRKGDAMKELPLLTVEDWSLQIIDLMQKIEHELGSSIIPYLEWTIVSNGGCVPIALEIGRKYVNHHDEDRKRPIFCGRLRGLVLSATPRAESMIRPQNLKKVQQSYRILSGIVGKVFWWYSLRRKGAFIESFSEKNLLASKPRSEWTPTCVETAQSFDGRSKYSTFAFLAGVLNGGNQIRLNSLKNRNDILVDVITGADQRKNSAKSWFWERRNRESDNAMIDGVAPTSLVEILIKNGNSARERIVNGRRCPAYEDPTGFAGALIDLLD